MARDKIHIDLVLNTKGFRPLGRINGQLGEFEKSLDASNARVLAFGASAGAILAVKKAFTATVKAAIEVEKSLQDINVILGATSANLKKFGSELFEIASKTGQAFQVAATAATELARQGLGTEETLKRTRDALILARLAGMDAAEAVNALTAAINTFNKAGLDSTTIINKLANVDAAFAVSSDDLAKALGRVGASAKSAGVSFDQLLAIVTTVQQKTARGGAVIGNSFKTIFTRIQRPRVIKELENLGIAIRGVEGEVLPAMKVLQNLARQFDNLSQSQKAQITELIGGVFQVNILKAAMSDLSKETGIYNRALGVSIGSSDQALRRNEELNKTLAAQFQRTVNTFKEGAAELGELTLGPALERMFGFVDEMSKIGESDFGKVGVSIAKSIFEGLGKFISGPGLLVIGLVLFKTFSQLGKFAADAFKTLTGLNKTLQTQQSLQRQVFDVLSENPDLLKKIKDGTMSVEDAHEAIYDQIKKNTGALDDQLLVSQQLARNLMSGGVGYSADFGATTGKKPRKFGSAGYIPSFAADRGEVLGMMAGGYSKSQIKNPKTRQQTIHDGRGGVFNATVNGHESVFTSENSRGKKATFVVPPKNSKAYDGYMAALSGGFVPNFMGSQADLNRLKEIKEAFAEVSRSQNPKVMADRQKLVLEARALGYKFGLDKDRSGDPNTSFHGAMPQKIFTDAGKRYAENLRGLAEQKMVKQGKAAVGPQGEFRGEIGEDGLIKGLEGRGAKPGLKVYDARKKYGLLGLYGVKETNKGYAEAPIAEISKLKKIAKLSPEDAKRNSRLGFERVGFKNLQYRSVTDYHEDAAQDKWFSGAVREEFAKPTQKLAKRFSERLLQGKGAIAVKIAKSGPALFPHGAEGEIFETIANSLSSGSSDAFKEALKSDPNKTWDFEGGGKFSDHFNFKKVAGAKFDGKRTLTENASKSLVNKIVNTPGGPAQGEVDALSKILGGQAKKAVKKGKRKAGGFIPNFNALFEAVRREREAGVPAGRIRVGRSDRLKNSANPSGFGIYNTRDEPMGLNQGINNSVAAGIDPKRKGMASGHIPNFRWNKGVTKAQVTGAGFEYNSAGVQEFKKSQNELTKATKQQTSSAMSTLVVMGLLQQGITGLNNAVDENNNKAKGIINALGAVASTIMAAKFASGELREMGMNRLSAERRDAVQAGKIGLGRASFGEVKDKFKGNIAAARKKKGLGKVAGMARAGMSATGGLAAAGSVGLAASGALTAIAGTAAVFNQIGVLATQTDFSATFKEARVAGKMLEKQKESTEKNIAKLNKFGTAAEQAAKTFEDQNATMSQVLDASRKMQKELDKLPIEFRTKLGGIMDPEKVNTMIQQFVSDEQKKTQKAQNRKDAADTLEATREKTYMDVFANPIDTLINLGTAGNLSGKTPEEIAQDQKQVKGVAAGILQRTIERNKGKFEAMDEEDFLKRFGGAKDDEERRAVAKELGMSDADYAIWTKWIQHGGEDFQKLAGHMANLIAETKAQLQVEKAMKPIREALLKQNRAQLKAIKDRKRVLESEQKIRKEVIKITAAGAKSFLTEVGKIKLDTHLKIGEARQEKATQFGGVISQTQKALTKASGSEALAGTAVEADIKKTLATASRGGVGSVSQATIDTQTTELDNLIAQLENSDKAEDPLVKQQVTELQSLKAELQNLGGTSDRLKEELKLQTKEIRAAAAAQKMVADQQRRLKSFGGPQALLDPTKLDPMLSKISAGGKAMMASARSGSRTGFNRGLINQLSGMQEMMGGELPEPMRRRGVAAATQVGVSQMSTLNRVMGFGMSPQEIRKAASEQANNLFKGDPQQQNTKALETLNTTLMANNDLIKHSRQDRVEIGAKEMRFGQDSATRQIGFMQRMQGADAVKQAGARDLGSLTRSMLDFRQSGGDYFVDENAHMMGSKDYKPKIVKRRADKNMSNEDLVKHFEWKKGPREGSHEDENSWMLREVDGERMRPQQFGETRDAYNKESREWEFNKHIEGARDVQRQGQEAVDKARGGPTTNNNTFTFTNGEVNADGTPTVEVVDAGISAMQDLKQKLKELEGGIELMDGGQAALNKTRLS